MNIQKREINNLFHLHGLTVTQIAAKVDLSVEETVRQIMTWNNFYQEITK